MAGATGSTECEPTDGVTGLLELFDQFPLVALGEMHGIEQGARFVEALVKHPSFATRVNAIVVEFGNAFHQQVADAYVAGEDVPMSAVRRIWHDFAGAVGPAGYRAPIYPEFFATVRGANAALPPDQRVRVLLGDPPVDWTAIRTPEDAKMIRAGRDEHFARVVEEQVLAQGKRSLLLTGLFHLTRVFPFEPPGWDREPETVTRILDREHPGATFVINPHVGFGFGEHLPDVETRLASWPAPGFAPIRGTWLGQLSAAIAFGGWPITLSGPAGTVSPPVARSSVILSDIFDGYLYLGPSATYTWSEPDFTPVDDEDRAELERRAALFGDPMRPEEG